MIDASPSPRLEMRWLPVQTPSGRTCMEAVWISVDVSASATAPVATHGHAA